MMNATLGGLIKDYRIKKRLSQLELSLKIGWKSSTRLSKIEQGRAGKPTRKTVDKIISALELTEQEKGDFLLTGNYPPTDEEVDLAIETIGEKIRKWPYPAYLFDFSWNVWLVNKPAIKVFGFPQSFLKTVRKANFNILDTVNYDLDIEMLKGDGEKNLESFAETLIAQYKAEHLGDENEKWYKKLINKLSVNAKFCKLWSTINAQDYHKKLYEYEYKIIRYPNGKKIAYHIFDSKLVSDRRFNVLLYLEDK